VVALLFNPEPKIQNRRLTPRLWSFCLDPPGHYSIGVEVGVSPPALDLLRGERAEDALGRAATSAVVMIVPAPPSATAQAVRLPSMNRRYLAGAPAGCSRTHGRRLFAIGPV
jgi:hypothetical protein